MSKHDTDPRRRRFLRGAAAGAVTVPVFGLLGTATAADKPKLDPGNGQAKALNYVHEASEASDNPAFQEGANCANCVHWTGGDAAWGGCNLFPNHVVSANGWCTAWAPKSG